jgi:hypothetical protein
MNEMRLGGTEEKRRWEDCKGGREKRKKRRV